MALLTLAAAPFGQWYLAWIALAPWFVAVGQAATIRGAVVRGWLAGVLYFGVNLWWLWTASIPGVVVLVMWFAVFWALAAGLLRGLQRLPTGAPMQNAWRAAYRVVGTAIVWVAVEWLRCNLAFGFPGLPVGCTQSPLPLMCQVADVGGPWIVSFWVVLPNALLATYWLNRNSSSRWRAAGVAVVTILAVVACYGAWRLHSTATTSGPRVMVIQSNFPHLRGGAPTAGRQQVVDFFIEELEKCLAQHAAELVVLPEAAFPPINDEARRELARSPVGPFLENTYQRLATIANDHHTTLVVGGNAVTGWSTHEGEHVGSEIRNSAYIFEPQANAAVRRYDKIHLVRFSERAPLANGPRWLSSLLIRISASRASQPMHAGALGTFEPFELNWSESDLVAGDTTPTADGNLPGGHVGVRFITPICLENTDPRIVAQMIRGSATRPKQADLIANLSNDGWFATQEKYQHLQSTVFRCIENRVPMARSSNTGISGFIDSTGHVQQIIGPGTNGCATRRIELDNRVTFYTRYGDVFAIACAVLVALAAGFRALSQRFAH